MQQEMPEIAQRVEQALRERWRRTDA